MSRRAITPDGQVTGKPKPVRGPLVGRRASARPPLRDVAPRPGHTAAFALQTDAFMAQPAHRAWPPPRALVEMLAASKRVVTIGHTPPDGDCVGAALGLARGLRLLGRQAHAIVDADLPGGLRALGGQGDVHRDPPDFEPDLVVLVDVAQADRIGRAAALLPSAPAVMVVDHHRVRPTVAQLGLVEGTPFTTWIDDRCDAASVQVAALLEAVGGAPRGWTDEWADVAEPLAAGIATDTQWFRSRRVNARSLSVFKGLLDSDINALESLEARLSHALPTTATVLLAAQLSAAVIRHGDTTAAELAVTEQARQGALEASLVADPRTTLEDISGHLMDRLDRLAARYGLAVLLQEEAQRRVRVSIRSRCDDLAVGLAVQLGGGGKRGVAGATVDGRLSDVQTRVRELVARQCGASAPLNPQAAGAECYS